MRVSVAPNAETRHSAQHTPSKEKQKQKGSKIWLKSGLYAGQPQDFDPRFSAKANEARKKGNTAVSKINKSLPMPMFSGHRLFEFGREFALPFDVFSPLPAKQPKPEEWRKTQTSRVSLPRLPKDAKTDSIQTVSWATLPPNGRRLNRFPPRAVCVRQRQVAMRTARIASCSTNVTTIIAASAPSSAPTVHLQT